MEADFWIDLIRRLPAPLHDALAFSLDSGGEIVAQSILRLEDDFVVLRGRVAGTQDQGRVIVLPFAHITHLAFNRRLSDPEVQAIFGAPPPPANVDFSPAPPEETPLEEENLQEQIQDEFEQPVTDTSRNTPLPTAARPAPLSKTVLLDRLRQRLAEQEKKDI